MKVSVIGGGPGGLYASILLTRADPSVRVTVHERNAPDDTFGFGVVFSAATLAELEDADPPSYEALMAACARWDPVELRYGGQRIRAGGNRFAAVSRHRLLHLLQSRARELEVDLRFNAEVEDATAVTREADLVIAADGANSRVRAAFARDFGPSAKLEGSTYIWLGTTKVFDAFTFVFLESEHGLFQAHIYPYSQSGSTFIVECDQATWRRAGLDAVDPSTLPPGANDDHSIKHLQALFADHLDGHDLLGNNSRWLDWRTVRTRRWRRDNLVLLGDAAHTAHFSIGSGTKLALEDAIALTRAVDTHYLRGGRSPEDLDLALLTYEGDRRPRVERVQEAAAESLDWFARYRRYWGFAAPQFAYSLLTRSARVDHDNLKQRDPDLVLAVDRWFARQAAGTDDEVLVPPPPALTPVTVGGLRLANRIVQVPDDRQDAVGGLPGQAFGRQLWRLRRGGAGLVVVDHLAVQPEGRLSPGDLGLWADEQVAAWRDLLGAAETAPLPGPGAPGVVAPVAASLTHAGPRGATRPRRDGVDRPLPAEARWPLVAASAAPYRRGGQAPTALDAQDMAVVIDAFAAAARRARDAGFAAVVVDMSRGELLASFLSPLANRRTDAYGGDLQARLRFPLTVLEAVRDAWRPSTVDHAGPVVVRVTLDDRQPGGTSPEDAVAIAHALHDRGADLVEVSAGQTTPYDRPEAAPEGDAPLSDLIRNEAGVPTLVGGGISSLSLADHVVVGGRADLVLIRPLPAVPTF